MNNENMDKSLKEMNPESREKALRIAHKYQIHEDDPSWMLVGLMVESVGGVEKIAQALREASVAVTAATAAEVKASREKAALEIAKSQEAAKVALAQALEKSMSTAVERAIDQIVQSTHVQALKIQARKWAGIGAVTAAVLLIGLTGGVGWEAWSKGEEAGRAFRADSLSEIHQDLKQYFACSEAGWKIMMKEGKKYCYPIPLKNGGVIGWRIQ